MRTRRGWSRSGWRLARPVREPARCPGGPGRAGPGRHRIAAPCRKACAAPDRRAGAAAGPSRPGPVLAAAGELADPVENELVPGQLSFHAQPGVLNDKVIGNCLVRPGPVPVVIELSGLS